MHAIGAVAVFEAFATAVALGLAVPFVALVAIAVLHALDAGVVAADRESDVAVRIARAFHADPPRSLAQTPAAPFAVVVDRTRSPAGVREGIAGASVTVVVVAALDAASVHVVAEGRGERALAVARAVQVGIFERERIQHLGLAPGGSGRPERDQERDQNGRSALAQAEKAHEIGLVPLARADCSSASGGRDGFARLPALLVLRVLNLSRALSWLCAELQYAVV